MIRGALLAFLLAQHAESPPDLTPEQRCAQECHFKHCGDWTACYSSPDPVRCQADVNRTEAECIRKCEAPRT